MSDKTAVNRRKVLQTTGLAIAGLAGCTGGGGGGDGGGADDQTQTEEDGGSDQDTPTATETSTPTPVEPTTWKIATGEEGTISGTATTGIARLLDQYSSILKLEQDRTSGSGVGFRLLDRGDADLSTGLNLLGVAAYEEINLTGQDFSGDNAVQTKPHQGWAFADERFFFVAMGDSGLETTADLQGKKVGLGSEGGHYVTHTVPDTAGFFDEIQPHSGGFGDLPFALREGRVDAIISYTTGKTAMPGFLKPQEDWDVTVLEWSDEHVTNLESSPFFSMEPVSISEVYTKDVGPDTMDCPTAPFQLWFHPDASSRLSYEITKVTYEHYEEFQEFGALFNIFTPEYATGVMNNAVPVHSGVVDYLKENDLWRDELKEA